MRPQRRMLCRLILGRAISFATAAIPARPIPPRAFVAVFLSPGGECSQGGPHHVDSSTAGRERDCECERGEALKPPGNHRPLSSHRFAATPSTLATVAVCLCVHFSSAQQLFAFSSITRSLSAVLLPRLLLLRLAGDTELTRSSSSQLPTPNLFPRALVAYTTLFVAPSRPCTYLNSLERLCPSLS
jgi:hypothetical protein